MSTPVEKMRNQEGETITVGNSSESIKSVNAVSILVVDDDITCLSIVAAILKKLHYEVVTVKHPKDALCALRIKAGAFDLVVTDVHMPDMNGFELQQAITQEFDLPVVLMSADDKEGVVLKGLDGGAAYFITKPVSPDDLKDLWQFASMKKKSQVVIEEIGSSPEEKSSSDKNISDEMAPSSVKEDTHSKKDSKRKSPRKEGSDERKGDKRPKVIWTNSLHNRFLEAIRSIGLDRAVPKKILEVMKVPGLTRENVASHLQKYRIFLRRVSDASYKLHYSADKNFSSRRFKPSFTSSFLLSGTTPSALNLDRFSILQNQNPGNFPGANIASFPNQGASSSNHITQSGFGQSRLLCNQGSFVSRPSMGHTNLKNQSDLPIFRHAPNIRTSTSIQGHFSNISLEDISRGLSASYYVSNLGPTGINLSGGYYVSSHKNAEISSSLVSVPTENYKFKTNYVGYELSNLQHLAGSGNNKKCDGFKSSDGTITTPSDEEFQNNNNVHSAAMVNDSITNLDQLVQHLESSSPSSPFNSDTNAGGKELSDVIADYEMLLPSNVPLQGNVENGVEIQEPVYSPMFDLSDFGIIPSPQPLEEGDLDARLPNEVNIQNQVEPNGGENMASSVFYRGKTHWDNTVPTFEQPPNQQQGHDVFPISQEFGSPSQVNTTPLPDNEQCEISFTNSMEFGTSSELNKTLKSPTEREDDDFLESLLAPSPYEVDQTFEGI